MSASAVSAMDMTKQTLNFARALDSRERTRQQRAARSKQMTMTRLPAHSTAAAAAVRRGACMVLLSLRRVPSTVNCRLLAVEICIIVHTHVESCTIIPPGGTRYQLN